MPGPWLTGLVIAAFGPPLTWLPSVARLSQPGSGPRGSLGKLAAIGGKLPRLADRHSDRGGVPTTTSSYLILRRGREVPP